VALAEALAAEIENLSPAARLDAARLAGRLLRWQLDGEIVDRGRCTWLCDRVLHAADYAVVKGAPLATEATSADSLLQTRDVARPGTELEDLPAPRPLEFPELPQEGRVRGPIASQVRPMTSPNVMPLPSVQGKTRSTDLADAWTMQSHRLGASSPQVSEMKIYPSTRERVLVPSSPGGGTPASESVVPLREMSLSECMRCLHDSGFESLAAEAELKRRGFDALRLSIARRVYHPDRQMRLQLVRDLPGITGIGATDWLLTMAGDEDEEVRLAAITLLATVGDPGLLAQVEAIARNDPAERIRIQGERLAKRRQALRR
jgi:HEAT repeat protein